MDSDIIKNEIARLKHKNEPNAKIPAKYPRHVHLFTAFNYCVKKRKTVENN